MMPDAAMALGVVLMSIKKERRLRLWLWPIVTR